MAGKTNNPGPTTWALYKAHLIRTQLAIIVVFVATALAVNPPILALALTFILLQAVAYAGVWWGLRAARRVAEKGNKLPLQDP